MAKIVDSIGEYVPIINCGCIDGRTKTHLDIIFKDAIREQDRIRSNENRPAVSRKAANRNISTILGLQDMFNKIKEC